MADTVLITGAAGFLGRYVARHFAGQKYKVVGIDCVPPENASVPAQGVYRQLQLPSPRFAELLREYRPTICVHCAGRASVGLSVEDPASDFQAGPPLTFELLNALRALPSCKFVFLSSAAVYGNPRTLPISEDQIPAPLSPYGYHKLQSELLCEEFAKVYNLRTASMRIFSAYGSGLRRQVVWDICRKALSDDGVILHGTGSESRDFIHAIDIARAVAVIAASASMHGETYNVATGREVLIRDLARLILDSMGNPRPLTFDGAVPAGTPLNWQADISRLGALGFAPSVSLEQGLRTFTVWCSAELANR
jgi:UDP-glucose 4-epimerase